MCGGRRDTRRRRALRVPARPHTGHECVAGGVTQDLTAVSRSACIHTLITLMLGGGWLGSPLSLLTCLRGLARLSACSPHATGRWQTRRRWLSHRTRASHSRHPFASMDDAQLARQHWPHVMYVHVYRVALMNSPGVSGAAGTHSTDPSSTAVEWLCKLCEGASSLPLLAPYRQLREGGWVKAI